MGIRRRNVRRLAVAVLACGAMSAGGLLASATTASASTTYGAGAAYQVEVSGSVTSFPSQLNPGPGASAGLWVWAALTPTSSTGGNVDYEETDCIHNVAIAPNGSSHNDGSATYTVNGNGTLTISGIGFGSGPGATTISITVSMAYNHYTFSPGNSVFGGGLPAQLLDGLGSGQIQVAH